MPIGSLGESWHVSIVCCAAHLLAPLRLEELDPVELLDGVAQRETPTTSFSVTFEVWKKYIGYIGYI